MLDNAPRGPEELRLVLNKRDPKTGRPGQVWHVAGPTLERGEQTWIVKAHAARQLLRENAKANEAALIARWASSDKTRLLTDDELAEYEAEPEPDSDEEAAKGKENAGGARNKAAAKAAAKAEKAAAKPGKKAGGKKRAAAEEDEDDGSGGDDDGDDSQEEEEEAPRKPKRKYVKKAKAEAKAAQMEPFFATVSVIVDHGLAASKPLAMLIQSLGLVAGNSDEVRTSVRRQRGIALHRTASHPSDVS